MNRRHLAGSPGRTPELGGYAFQLEVVPGIAAKPVRDLVGRGGFEPPTNGLKEELFNDRQRPTFSLRFPCMPVEGWRPSQFRLFGLGSNQSI